MSLLSAKKLPVESFVQKHLYRNDPALISGEFCDQLRDLWVHEGRLNVDQLLRDFGKCLISVHECVLNHDEISKQPQEMSFRAFFENYWRAEDVLPSTEMYRSMQKEFHQFIQNAHLQPADNDLHQTLQQIHEKFLMTDRDAAWYLKDWHMTRDWQTQFPDSGPLYTTADYFKVDWLNHYWDSEYPGQDDYRFVYIGTPGSWTRFHADVFRSYSWSTNITGCKIWFLIPPGQLDGLRDDQGNLPDDLLRASPARFKHMHKVKPVFVYQVPGETIFVPSGWFHQVHNIGPTVSVNHNWLNGFNLLFCTKYILKELHKIRESLVDLLQDKRLGMTRIQWEQECQILLKAHAGMDIEMWLSMIKRHANQQEDYEKIMVHEDVSALNHIESQVRKSLQLITSDPHLRQLYQLV